nr:putative formate transporter [Quercus suber]
MLLHWFITFWGNLAGSLFVMAIITGYGDVFSASVYKSEVFAFASTKAIVPEWHSIFLRGIGANWLVCMACFLAFMAREYFSAVVAIWFPTFAFVCLGLDHVVANMFFIPMAIFLGDPDISVSFYIWKSLIPALIGNIIGGGLFVGVMFWYLAEMLQLPGAKELRQAERHLLSTSSDPACPSEVIRIVSSSGLDTKHQGQWRFTPPAEARWDEDQH